MAVSITPATGGKKPLDAELNLIPFIDLLVCCICFLLITAVWIQMSRITASQRSPAAGSERSTEARIALLVGEEGYTITVGAERLAIPKQGETYDTEALGRQLVQLRSRLSHAQELTVAAEDPIKYRHLVRAMDVARGSHFERIHLSDPAARL